MSEHDQAGSGASEPPLSVGRLAEIACLLEVTARKPGNVHRFADFEDLHILDFLLSATAIAAPLDQAGERGIGATVLAAVRATRQVVSTNTNLGMILLLAPLAAVPRDDALGEGVERALAATTIEDARAVYQAIRLAAPGGLGHVKEQDLAGEPTATLRETMALAADHDMVARQYANGFHEVLHEVLPTIQAYLCRDPRLETAIVTAYLQVLAEHHDTLIIRKAGHAAAEAVTRKATQVLDAGWPASRQSRALARQFETWLRSRNRLLNPGTTADLITAALFAGLRDGTIPLPRRPGSASWSGR